MKICDGENLTFLERGRRVAKPDRMTMDLTQEVLAEKLAKSPHYIQKIAYSKIGRPSTKSFCMEHDFTERHAKALLRLPDTKSRMASFGKK